MTNEEMQKQWAEFKSLVSRLVSTGVDEEASKILSKQFKITTVEQFIANKKIRSERDAIRIGGRKTRQY